jgi:hypothetical protein
MDSILVRAVALFQVDPMYWSGVVLWLLGLAAYVPAVCGRGRLVLSRTGIVLCWLGFAITLLAHFALNESYRLPPFETPTLDPAYWRRSSTQIWILWILGSALVAAGWLRWFTARIGWLGLTTAMVGVIAAWFPAEATRHATIQLGTAIVSALLIVMVWRGDLFVRAIEPGDYEAELIKLCNSRRRARRLIREEMARKPGLSKAGAALAAVTRLKHERDPYPRPL